MRIYYDLPWLSWCRCGGRCKRGTRSRQAVWGTWLHLYIYKQHGHASRWWFRQRSILPVPITGVLTHGLHIDIKTAKVSQNENILRLTLAVLMSMWRPCVRTPVIGTGRIDRWRNHHLDAWPCCLYMYKCNQVPQTACRDRVPRLHLPPHRHQDSQGKS